MLEMALQRNAPAGMGSSHSPRQGPVDGQVQRVRRTVLPISFTCRRRKAVGPGCCWGRARHRSTNRYYGRLG